jgi:hypothetical protein
MPTLLLGDKAYQWYVLGWATTMIRPAKGCWDKVQNGDTIRLDSDGSGGTTWMVVVDTAHGATIEELVTKNNYMLIYPRSTGPENTCRFVGTTFLPPPAYSRHVEGGYVRLSLKHASVLEASESELDQFSGSTKGLSRN